MQRQGRGFDPRTDQVHFFLPMLVPRRALLRGWYLCGTSLLPTLAHVLDYACVDQTLIFYFLSMLILYNRILWC
jgi:hypothetical protein